MNQTSRMQWTSLALVLIALLLVLKYGLLAALISGLLVYHLVEMGARRLGRIGIIPATGKVMLLVLLVVIVVTLIALGVLGIESQLAQGPESLAALLQREEQEQAGDGNDDQADQAFEQRFTHQGFQAS